MILSVAPLCLALLAAPPYIAEFYGDDPQLELKAQIEELMGVYLVDPPRRHPSEKVILNGGRVRVDLWHPVGRASDVELKTRAVKWLVFGRTKFSSGARGVFSEVPSAQEVVLIFHEVLRDEKGRRGTKEEVKRYLALRIDRGRFERINLDAIEGCVGRGDCSAIFRSAFSQQKFDRRYTAKRRRDDG